MTQAHDSTLDALRDGHGVRLQLIDRPASLKIESLLRLANGVPNTHLF